MGDYLNSTLAAAVRTELRDNDATQWPDTEVVLYINDGLMFLTNLLRKYHKYAMIAEDYTRYVLDLDNFSYDNEHDLPENFFDMIRLKKVGGDLPLRRGNLELMDNDSSEARYMLRACRVGAPVPAVANTGTNLLQTQGDYSGTTDRTYTITMTSATGFSWARSGGSGVGTASTAWQTLEDGVQVKWPTLTGIATGDVYTFVAKATYKVQVLRLNYDPAVDLELEYVRFPTLHALTGSSLTSAYIPYRRYYLALKEYVKLRCLNSNEMNVSIDAALMAPVVEMVMSVAADIEDDDNGTIEPGYMAGDML
jgi:hypothetical protein